MKRRKSARTDNGFLELKRLIRSRLIGAIEPGTAVIFFAGEGRALAGALERFDLVHAVDRDPAKFVRLLARAEELKARLGREALRPYCMDNHAFVRTVLGGIRGVNYLDFDAYGSPNRLIQKTLEHWRPETRSAIAVTDGGRIAQVRKSRFAPDRFLVDPSPETREGGGPAQPRVAARPLSALEYELLVKRFWDRLAQTRGLVVERFVTAWRRERRVLYYGLVVSPDRNHLDPA